MFAGVCLSVGLVCGLINGVLVSSAGLTPTIATLGISLAFTGVSVVLTNGSGVRLGYIEPLDDFGHMPVFGIPICFGLFLIVAAAIGGAEQPKGFWFNVNAELIIYGATEPTARVTLDGREIKLRPDGSFSFRFALPDGKYELPAVAVSADGTEARAADLKFSRDTEYRGDVGAHPQDPALKPPSPDNV